jgi:5-methylcytosine-specific restriction protein A
LAVHGHRCFVCDDDLGKIYGEIGKGFIHVHHLHPLVERKGVDVTDPKKDLIPVCPNCHSIIHRGGGTRSPEEVRRHLSRAKRAAQRKTDRSRC